MTPRRLIVGAGGHGRSVAEAVADSRAFKVIGFGDDAFPESGPVWGIPVLGKVSDWLKFRNHTACWFVAIGNNTVSSATSCLLVNAGLTLAKVIHPKTIVATSAIIGARSVLTASAVVGTEAVLDEGPIVNCSAVVDQHSRVGDFGHLGGGSEMLGRAVTGKGAWMQANSALNYGVEIEGRRALAPTEAASQ